jgi:hypothetical protein
MAIFNSYVSLPEGNHIWDPTYIPNIHPNDMGSNMKKMWNLIITWDRMCLETIKCDIVMPSRIGISLTQLGSKQQEMNMYCNTTNHRGVSNCLLFIGIKHWGCYGIGWRDMTGPSQTVAVGDTGNATTWQFPWMWKTGDSGEWFGAIPYIPTLWTTPCHTPFGCFVHIPS